MSPHPDSIFEIHQLWQSSFSRVYSNCCCSCSFEAEIIKIGQPSYKMYSNNIVNFQEFTTISNACTKKSPNLLNVLCYYINIYIYIYSDYTKSTNYNWYECLFCVPQFFQFSTKVEVLSILLCGHNFASSLFLYYYYY